MTSKKNLFFYALPALPLAALFMPVYIFLPTYYAETLGLGLFAVGFVRVLSGLWDMLTDPIIGIVSDKTKSKFGRRKFWILLGLPFTLLGSWFLLVPYGTASLFSMGFWSLIMVTGWTMMLLPLNALAGELCPEYHDRNRINAWRESFSILGVLIPLALIAALGFSDSGEQGQALHVIAVFVGLILPLFTALFIWFVKEPAPRETPSFSLSSALNIFKNNKPFQILIRSYFLNAVANGLPASLILLYVDRVLSAPEKVGQFLFIYFLAAILSAPLWNFIGKRYLKHKIWCVAMGIACIVFAFIPFLSAGDILPYLIICILTGIVFGADLIFPPSMQADVVDHDTDLNGTERAGLFFALWGIATKLSLALATGFAFMLLDVFQDSNMMLIMLYALIPVGFKLLSMRGMWNFPLKSKV